MECLTVSGDGTNLGITCLVLLALIRTRDPCPVFGSSTVSRVSRSYSLKAKTSENVGIFVLAFKRKKCFFFALFAIKRNTPNSEKNESEMSQKRKEKRKITIPVKV